MSISFESGSEKLRERLREMSDSDLIKFGKAARNLCRDPRACKEFKWQLDQARAEWRRRHPTTV